MLDGRAGPGLLGGGDSYKARKKGFLDLKVWAQKTGTPLSLLVAGSIGILVFTIVVGIKLSHIFSSSHLYSSSSSSPPLYEKGSSTPRPSSNGGGTNMPSDEMRREQAKLKMHPKTSSPTPPPPPPPPQEAASYMGGGECLGWWASTDCTSSGPRSVSDDLSCSSYIEPGMAGHCDCADSTTLRPFQIPFECERGRAHFTCVTACARGPPATTRGNDGAAGNAGGGSRIGSSPERGRGEEEEEEGAVLGGGGALAKAAERAEQRLREEQRQRAEEEKRRKEEEEAAELAAKEAHDLKGDDLLLEATSFLEEGRFEEAAKALSDAKIAYTEAGSLSEEAVSGGMPMHKLYKLKHATSKDLALSGVADSLQQEKLRKAEEERKYREEQKEEARRKEEAIKEAKRMQIESEERKLDQIKSMHGQMENKRRDEARSKLKEVNDETIRRRRESDESDPEAVEAEKKFDAFRRRRKFTPAPAPVVNQPAPPPPDLAGELQRRGIGELEQKLKDMGVDHLADLKYLDDETLQGMELKPVHFKKLQTLVEQNLGTERK